MKEKCPICSKRAKIFKSFGLEYLKCNTCKNILILPDEFQNLDGLDRRRLRNFFTNQNMRSCVNEKNDKRL